LAQFRGEAPFIDIDDGDRPCGLHAGVDALEGIEGPDAELLDRGRIGDAQRRKPDQERQAYQPRIPEPTLEPTPQYLQPLHADQISRPASDMELNSGLPDRAQSGLVALGEECLN
jgi:hypothetical protein